MASTDASPEDDPHQIHRTSVELDSLAQQTARLHYEDQLPLRQVPSELPGVKDARDATFLLKRALDPHNPLVEVRVEFKSGGLAGMDLDLAKDLAVKTGIRWVLVVKTSLPSGSMSWEPDDEREELVLSHVLHRQLGRAAGKFLWDRIVDRDIIAVGAGRGVRYTVDALRSLALTERRTFVDLQVVALAGNGVVRPYPRERGARDGIRGWPELEPDQIALELGRVLDVDVKRITLARLPFVLEDPASVVPQVAPHLDPDVPWGRDTPDKAIFGLGVLNQNHHLLASMGSNVTKVVDDILNQLKREVLSSYPAAVIDVYDSFWVRENELPPDIERRAKELVEELNSKIVVLGRAKTDQAREKILVAGGPLKYEGMRAYIRQHETVGVTPTVLVTDHLTAGQLLEDL